MAVRPEPTPDEQTRQAFERVGAFVDLYARPVGSALRSLRSTSDDLAEGVIVTAVRADGSTAPLLVGDLAAILLANVPARIVMPAGPPPTPEDLRRAIESTQIVVQPGHRLTGDEPELVAEAARDYAERLDDYADQFSIVDARLDRGETQAQAARLRDLAQRLAPEIDEPHD